MTRACRKQCRRNRARVVRAPASTGSLARAKQRERRQRAASSYVHPGPAKRIVFRLPEHFARHRRGIAFAEGEELEKIRDRIAFRPSEVDVRNLSRAVANVEEQRGNRV